MMADKNFLILGISAGLKRLYWLLEFPGAKVQDGYCRKELSLLP